jgi:alpha-N-arabinofuranosidase
MNPRLLYVAAALLLAAPFSAGAELTANVAIDGSKSGPVINRNIYGQFSEHLGRCIYEGIWVDENSPIPNTKGYRNDVLAAVKELHVPVLRWPGGCFADEYHWRDGIGPRESRPAMINTHWGGVVENNHFGTHEFLDFCEMLGIEPYVCVNVGSGTVQEAMEWIEYMTSDANSPLANLRRKNGRDKPWKVHFIAVGNENWGCGGNMTPEFYADNFRRYATFLKSYPGNEVLRMACGANEDDYEWTDVLMKRAGRHMNGLSLHYYTKTAKPWPPKGSATEFGENEWMSILKNTLHMDELVTKHGAVMDKYDPEKKIPLAVDEWGTWYQSTPGSHPGFLEQQNTLRDALVAGLNLHIFQKHADRVGMANIAQFVNVLQAMILTDKEKMIVTPTYWVFDMYKPFQDATALPLQVQSPDYTFGSDSIPAVSASAAKAKDGFVYVSFVNCDPKQSIAVDAKLVGVSATTATGQVLTADAMNAHNTFDQPNTVKPATFTAAQIAGGTLHVTLPAKSVVMLQLK